MHYKQYLKWLTDPYFDPDTQAELQALNDNPEEIVDRFYRRLEFGTGGLRGKIGAGTNRMNKYVVRQATQGLAGYVKAFGTGAMERGVVIAYDSRHYSREFAQEAALILAANGIKAFVFDSLRPTPELSFAVRELKAIAGIVITASHNPPQYNGYKVYWEDGGQIPPARAEAVLAQIESIADITSIYPLSLSEAVSTGLYQEIGEEIDKAYLDRIKGLVVNPDIIGHMADKSKILYSPLHGSGNMPVRRVLKELGFKRVIVVPEQEQPDPDFPTVSYPNPEEPEAFALALELAKTELPDLIMATDPDADRIGAAALDQAGRYRLLSGNQVGVLLAFYILSQLKGQGRMPDNAVVVKTIVTTDMLLPLARDFGVEVDQTLTGFKFIGEKIYEYEKTGNKTFLFGFEESYGYLAGTFVRDKDAVCAAVLLAEAVSYFKSQGHTLFEVLEQLWVKYGYYQEALHTIVLEGKTGQEKTAYLMEQVRRLNLLSFAGHRVSRIEDYFTGKGKDMITGEEFALTLPKSDVLKFCLSGGGYVVFRPSGTEPKAKIYLSLTGSSLAETRGSLTEVKEELLSKVDEILSSFCPS